jgi:hypothetical protein
MQQIDTVECLLGTLQQMNAVTREISVRSDAGIELFDVPPDSLVFLRGEQIKLRLIQPGDRVRVTFVKISGSRIAKILEVQPESDLSSPQV